MKKKTPEKRTTCERMEKRFSSREKENMQKIKWKDISRQCRNIKKDEEDNYKLEKDRKQ